MKNDNDSELRSEDLQNIPIIFDAASPGIADPGGTHPPGYFDSDRVRQTGFRNILKTVQEAACGYLFCFLFVCGFFPHLFSLHFPALLLLYEFFPPRHLFLLSDGMRRISDLPDKINPFV
ncbi:hypothetical protein J5839_04645 [Methanosarcinaceae archaeon]|nr:hypothetical protein [Methanosarcinaceae archaeon]